MESRFRSGTDGPMVVGGVQSGPMGLWRKWAGHRYGVDVTRWHGWRTDRCFWSFVSPKFWLMTVGMFFPLSPERPTPLKGVSTTGPQPRTRTLSLALSPTPHQQKHTHTYFCSSSGPRWLLPTHLYCKALNIGPVCVAVGTCAHVNPHS